jgi:hypothetical protein
MNNDNNMSTTAQYCNSLRASKSSYGIVIFSCFHTATKAEIKILKTGTNPANSYVDFENEPTKVDGAFEARYLHEESLVFPRNFGTVLFKLRSIASIGQCPSFGEIRGLKNGGKMA